MPDRISRLTVFIFQTPHMVSYVLCVGALLNPHTFSCVLCGNTLRLSHSLLCALCGSTPRPSHLLLCALCGNTPRPSHLLLCALCVSTLRPSHPLCALCGSKLTTLNWKVKYGSAQAPPRSSQSLHSIAKAVSSYFQSHSQTSLGSTPFSPESRAPCHMRLVAYWASGNKVWKGVLSSGGITPWKHVTISGCKGQKELNRLPWGSGGGPGHFKFHCHFRECLAMFTSSVPFEQKLFHGDHGWPFPLIKASLGFRRWESNKPCLVCPGPRHTEDKSCTL